MYSLVIVLHSLLRWAVLILGLAAFGRALAGVSGRRAWEPGGARVGLLFMISVDVQFLLGVLLYGWLSPFTKTAFANFGAAMRDRYLRFWAVEHALMMVLAMVMVHVGRVAARRATTDLARHRRAALWFGVALLLMVVATPWPFLPYGRPLFRLG